VLPACLSPLDVLLSPNCCLPPSLPCVPSRLQSPPSGAAGPQPNPSCATPVVRATGAHTTSAPPSPQQAAWGAPAPRRLAAVAAAAMPAAAAARRAARGWQQQRPWGPPHCLSTWRGVCTQGLGSHATPTLGPHSSITGQRTMRCEAADVLAVPGAAAVQGGTCAARCAPADRLYCRV
jgi:hypothetical protein